MYSVQKDYISLTHFSRKKNRMGKPRTVMHEVNFIMSRKSRIVKNISEINNFDIVIIGF